MHRIAILCCAATLVACSKSETKSPDTTPAAAAAPATPPPAPAISLASIAGKWNAKIMNQAGDSTLTTYQLTATADTSGWTITFPKRAPIPVHVMVSGDSLMLDEAPHESVLRKGVRVTAHVVERLQDGKLVGTGIAHYNTKGADSVRTLHVEATRAP